MSMYTYREIEQIDRIDREIVRVRVSRKQNFNFFIYSIYLSTLSIVRSIYIKRFDIVR